MRLFLTFGALFLGLLGPLAAETMPSKPDRYFNDYAGVVDQATALQLNEQLAQFERDTSTQLVVAIYRTMESESSVADYTQRIAQTWGVGQKGRNNGAVLFVFVANHQMFIQTGLRPGRRVAGRDLLRHHPQRDRAVLQEERLPGRS